MGVPKIEVEYSLLRIGIAAFTVGNQDFQRRGTVFVDPRCK
jgi:hypothetical protein